MTDFIGPNGETINPDSLRARLSVETQREIDARFASYFSTSSELGAFAAEDVRELGKNAR